MRTKFLAITDRFAGLQAEWSLPRAIRWTVHCSPGNDEIQLDLFLDYQSNVKLYPKFQEFLRTNRMPVLAVWGKNDSFFLPPGAEVFRRDVPTAKVKFYDTGNFALETHHAEIVEDIAEFLGKLPISYPANSGAKIPSGSLTLQRA